MNRYFIDCRDHPSDVKCSVALSADTKEELLEAVVQHGGSARCLIYSGGLLLLIKGE